MFWDVMPSLTHTPFFSYHDFLACHNLSAWIKFILFLSSESLWCNQSLTNQNLNELRFPIQLTFNAALPELSVGIEGPMNGTREVNHAFLLPPNGGQKKMIPLILLKRFPISSLAPALANWTACLIISIVMREPYEKEIKTIWSTSAGDKRCLRVWLKSTFTEGYLTTAWKILNATKQQWIPQCPWLLRLALTKECLAWNFACSKRKESARRCTERCPYKGQSSLEYDRYLQKSELPRQRTSSARQSNVVHLSEESQLRR